MKKFSLIALIASSLIFIGCGQKSGEEGATSSVTDAVTGAATDAMDATKDAAKDAAKEVADTAKEAATKAVDTAKDAAKEAVTTATDTAKEAATKAVDAAKEAATKTVDTAKEAVAPAADAAATATEGSDGQALFAKCAGCHGTDGKTAALGKSEIIAGQSAADLETKIAEYKAGTRDVKGMGALMKSQVASYSDADIKAVAEYISTLK